MANETIAKPVKVVAILADEKGKRGNAVRQKLRHLLIRHCARIDQNGWRYVSRGKALETSLSTKGVRFLSIGLKGVAGYYEFGPFSTIS